MSDKPRVTIYNDTELADTIDKCEVGDVIYLEPDNQEGIKTFRVVMKKQMDDDGNYIKDSNGEYVMEKSVDTIEDDQMNMGGKKQTKKRKSKKITKKRRTKKSIKKTNKKHKK